MRISYWSSDVCSSDLDVCNGDRLWEGRRTVRNHRWRESLLCRFRGPLPRDRPGLRYADQAGHPGGTAARDESRHAGRLGRAREGGGKWRGGGSGAGTGELATPELGTRVPGASAQPCTCWLTTRDTERSRV